jgi:hypothetical protein
MYDRRGDDNRDDWNNGDDMDYDNYDGGYANGYARRNSPNYRNGGSNYAGRASTYNGGSAAYNRTSYAHDGSQDYAGGYNGASSGSRWNYAGNR